LALLAATQVAGCIITSDNTDDEARITVNWELRNVGSNVLQACPSGYDTVALYSQPVDANGNQVGSEIIDLFRCNDGTGVSAPLPPTTYLSWIEVTNTNNTAQYARSLGAYVDVTVEDKTLDAAIFFDGGYFQIDWELAGAVTRRLVECSEVPGFDHVKVTSFLSSAEQGIQDRYNCEDHTGVTAALLAGEYSILVDPIGGGSTRLGPGVQFDGVRISGPNRVTTLRDIGAPSPLPLFIDGL
jgi:hypothetical protein